MGSTNSFSKNNTYISCVPLNSDSHRMKYNKAFVSQFSSSVSQLSPYLERIHADPPQRAHVNQLNSKRFCPRMRAFNVTALCQALLFYDFVCKNVGFLFRSVFPLFSAPQVSQNRMNSLRHIPTTVSNKDRQYSTDRTSVHVVGTSSLSHGRFIDQSSSG